MSTPHDTPPSHNDTWSEDIDDDGAPFAQCPRCGSPAELIPDHRTLRTRWECFQCPEVSEWV